MNYPFKYGSKAIFQVPGLADKYHCYSRGNSKALNVRKPMKPNSKALTQRKAFILVLVILLVTTETLPGQERIHKGFYFSLGEVPPLEVLLPKTPKHSHLQV